jgi:hypothetical protein
MASLADALTIGFGTLTTILAFLISFQAYRAYRFTGRRYLVNFVASFLLLGISFYLVGFLFSSVVSPVLQRNLEWVRLVMQAVAYGLLASAYFSRSRRGESLLLGVLVTAALVTIPLLNLVTPPPPSPVNEYIYFAIFILTLYILTQVSRGYAVNQESVAFLATSGFGLLAFSQFSWFIWSADGGVISILFALLFRLFGLTLIVLSLVRLGEKRG